MPAYTVLLDANVLYPAPMRDLLMQLALADHFRARWTSKIHDEWIEALLKNDPGRSREKLMATRNLMNIHVRDCLIEDYQRLIPSLDLPDPNDRHVLAAAIAGKCDCIITQNIRDFPAEALAPFGLETQHPDEFLSNLLNMTPGAFCSSVRKVRARLKNPPYSAQQYLDALRNCGLIATAVELSAFDQLI